MTISERFGQTILNVYGKKGRVWLTELPRLLSSFAQRWSLEVAEPFPNLTYGYVAPATCADGRRAVIKASPGDEIRAEIAALQHYAARDAVEVLAADPEAGVFLMEQILPGRTLFEEVANDAEATHIAARLMQRIWAPTPEAHNFPTVAQWGEGFARLRHSYEGATGPLPAALLGRAEGLFHELLQDSAPAVVLHGDLHHWNILSCYPDRWAVIDPKGVVGEPAYEAGAWLRNPITELLTWPELEHVLAARLDILAEVTGQDRERMKRWGMAQAILSACWSLEDNEEGWEPMITLASALERCR